MTWSNTLAWLFMVLMAVAIGLYALIFFLVPDMGDPAFKEHFETIPLSARMHIIPGGLALILGAMALT